MASFPNRCQHIKVNGTQCGCPALRRNRFCYFHKRHHEERIQLNADRARRRPAIVELPVLEDANSIQVSLMQIMRLLVAGQIDGKTAGLLLYALQTATLNLARTTFEPRMHNVILDPATVRETPLGAHIWEDDDFIDEEEDEEATRTEALEQARRQAAKKAELQRWAEAEANRITQEGIQQREAARQKAAQVAETIRKLNAQPAPAQGRTIEAAAETSPLPSAAVTPAGRALLPPPQPGPTTRKRPPTTVDMNEVRKQVRAVIRKALPALAAQLNEQLKKKTKSAPT